MSKPLKTYKCLKCLHEWAGKGVLPPVMCPNHKCRSPRWQYPKGFDVFKGKMKGQITIINLLMLFAVGLVFFMFLPIITSFTTSYALPAVASSSMDQSTKDLTTALINAFPIIVFIGIAATAWAYAIPKREGQ